MKWAVLWFLFILFCRLLHIVLDQARCVFFSFCPLIFGAKSLVFPKERGIIVKYNEEREAEMAYIYTF